MENKKDKGILISDVQLVDIIDRYEFLMFQLNAHIEPTINKMIQLQKEVQNLDALLLKIKNIEGLLIQVNQKIENSTNQILNQKIDETVKIKIDEKSEILDVKIKKLNQKIYKKELFVISISCLFLGILIGYFL